MTHSRKLLVLVAAAIIVLPLALVTSSEYMRSQLAGFDAGPPAYDGDVVQPSLDGDAGSFDPAAEPQNNDQGRDGSFAGGFPPSFALNFSSSSRSSSSASFVVDPGGFCCVDLGGGSMRCVPGFTCRDTLQQCSAKCGSQSSRSVSSSSRSSSVSSFVDNAGYCCVDVGGGSKRCMPSFSCRDTLQQCSAKCGGSSSSMSSSTCNSQTPLFSDLSVILDVQQAVLSPGASTTFLVRVRNSGKDPIPGATVFLLRSDMTYVQSSVFCFVQDSDPTYVRCTVPDIGPNQQAVFTVAMRMPPNFTCIDSTAGRSVFAFVRAASGGNEDLYPQNNTSNIVNLMPTCN